MKDLNRIELKGRVGSVDSSRAVGNGTVTRFTLATNRSYKDANGEWQTETTWHRLECWSGYGRVAPERIVRGQMMYVCGRIKQDQYTDQQGYDRQQTIVVVEECDIITEPPQDMPENL